MKPILIQGAENSEISYFLQTIKNKKEIEIGSFKFWTGEMNDYPVVISRTKVGEVNAAAATTIAIMHFEPKYIINQGTAGSHSNRIRRGEIVIGEKYFPLTHFKVEPNEEWELETYQSDDDAPTAREADADLLEFAKKICDIPNVHFGTIGSGDIWNKSIERIDFLHNNYDTLCEEMETAGVYNTANSFGVPVLGIRIISNNEILKEEYNPELSTECQKFVEKFIIELVKR